MASRGRTSRSRASVRRTAFIVAVLVYVGERLLLDAYTESFARSYRPPVIALAHPAPGGYIRSARPIIVLRFVPGEPSDPVDVTTLRIVIDGEDRTGRFDVTASEAWGPVARDHGGDYGGDQGEPHAVSREPRVHRVTARVCSSRGVCGSTSAMVRVASDVID